MSLVQRVTDFWHDIHNQNWDKLADYFSETAVINWHHTNEQFTVDEYILINSEYPGTWIIETEHFLEVDGFVTSVIKAFAPDKSVIFHAVSFFSFEDTKICTLDEYWSLVIEPPQWRKEMKVGRPLHNS